MGRERVLDFRMGGCPSCGSEAETSRAKGASWNTTSPATRMGASRARAAGLRGRLLVWLVFLFRCPHSANERGPAPPQCGRCARRTGLFELGRRRRAQAAWRGVRVAGHGSWTVGTGSKRHRLTLAHPKRAPKNAVFAPGSRCTRRLPGRTPPPKPAKRRHACLVSGKAPTSRIHHGRRNHRPWVMVACESMQCQYLTTALRCQTRAK